MKRRIAMILIIAILLGMFPLQVFGEQTEQPEEIQTKAATTRSPSGYWTDYAADSFAGGDGSDASPYQIATAAQLAKLAVKGLTSSYHYGSYELIADIDLSAHLWRPISGFAGSINGNGYTISGMTITNSYEEDSRNGYAYTGFFGEIGGATGNSDGPDSHIYNVIFRAPQITLSTYPQKNIYIGGVVGETSYNLKNIIVQDASLSCTGTFTGSNLYMGGICGKSAAQIQNCSFSGSINNVISLVNDGNFHFVYVGGIAGSTKHPNSTYLNSIIDSCSTSGTIVNTVQNGTHDVGGLIGSSGSEVRNCYSSMKVTANSTNASYAGGLIGSAGNCTVTNCYASGNVSATSYNSASYAGGLIGSVSYTGSTATVTVKNCFTCNGSIEANTNKDNTTTYVGRVVSWASYINTENIHASSATRVKRYLFTAGSGCNSSDKYEQRDDASNTIGATDYSYSESFIRNTMKWGIYVSQQDVATNTGNVWLCFAKAPLLHTDDRLTLTIRYVLEDGSVSDVYFGYYDYSANYSVRSPSLNGLAPDTEVVSGTIKSNTYVDVYYSHVHIPGPEATCTTQQICTLCGAILAQKTPHTHVAGTPVAATCTEGGYTVYTCTACRDSYQSDFTAPNGHQLDSGNVCINCGESFPVAPRDFAVFLYDRETGKPVTGASVTLYEKTLHTDSSGAAKYQLTEKTPTTLTIRANGYPDRVTKDFVPSEMPSTYIYLESDETGIYEAWCNGDNVLLISSQINSRSPALTARIVVAGRAKANITKYELVQDGQVIASSTDGVFKVKNPYFKQNTPVYARMHTDGQSNYNLYEQKLNIDVVGFKFEAELDDLLPFTGGMDIDFTDGVPLISGVNFKMPAYGLGDDGFMKIHAQNKKLIVTFGQETDYFDNSVDNKTMAEIMKDLKDNFVKQNHPRAWPKGKPKSEVTVSGAIVLEFNKDAAITAAYGQVNIGYELSYKWGKTFVVWVVPIYAGFKAGLEGELEITEFGYDFENSEIMIPDLDVTLKAEISLYGGLGCSVISAGVYGAVGGEIKMGVKDLKEYFRYLLYGEMGLYARIDLFFWKELEYRLPLMYDDIYGPNGQVKLKKALYTPQEYETSQREYLQERSDWLNTSLYVDQGDAHGILQTSVYDGIEPRIVQSGDTIMMLFMDDDGTEGFNYQHLYFSVFDKANNTWGTPIRVDDSHFSDLEYDVYADDSGIYLAYTKAGEITQENQNNYTEIMAGVEVYCAHYDTVNSCFAGHTNVSNNNSFDAQPQVTASAVAWINNHTNDALAENANNVLMLSQYVNSSWQQPTTLDNHGATVASMDLGTMDGKTYIATIRDVDCDLSTEDRRLEVMDTNGNVTVLTTVQQAVDGVKFTNISGTDVLQWYCDSNIWQLKTTDEAPTGLLAQQDQGLTGEFKHLKLGENKSVILFVKNTRQDDAAGSSIYGIYNVNGIWGQAVPITQHMPELYVDAFDACTYNGKLLMSYITTEATFTENDIVRSSNFLTSCIEIKDDLAVDQAVFLESELFEGSTVELKLPITNLSWQPLQSVTVQLLDEKNNMVTQQLINLEDSLGSGDTAYVTVTLDKSKLAAGTGYSLYATTPDWADDDVSNNKTELLLWYTDFEVNAQQQLVAGKAQIHYALTNSGNIAGSAQVKVYKKDTNEQLHTQTVALKAGQTISNMVAVPEGYSGVVYIEVFPAAAELYNFNNKVSLTVGQFTSGKTEDITGAAAAVPAPVVNEPYVAYDLYTGGNVTAPVTENGWSFTGIKELGAANYSYSGGLQLAESYLKTLPTGYHYYTLNYSLNGSTSQAMLILEITDSTPAAAPLTAKDQSVQYNAAPVELTDLIYETPSTGAVTVSYSNGANWTAGLPAAIGEYTVKLCVAADEIYGPAETTFTLTITKGTRAISVPTRIATTNGWVTFSQAIPTAGTTDGQITYGCSTENDAATVAQWSESGAVPTEDPDAIYYIFARITGGNNFEDAYSVGYPVKAHEHSFTQDSCSSCGAIPVAAVYRNGQWVSGHDSLSGAADSATASNSYVLLCRDMEVDMSMNRDLYVDLNGYDLTGIIRTNGYKIYGMDNTTDSYSCENIGRLRCTDESGSPIKPETHLKTSVTGAIRRYVAVLSDNQYSFHRIYLGVTHMSARPSSTGVGFKAVFYADEMVVSMLDSTNAYGYTLQLSGYSPVTAYKGTDSFASGKTVTLRLENYDVERFGETPLYASVMVKLADGTVIESSQVTMTLRQLVEYMNDHTEEFTQVQLSAMKSMISKYPIMRTWKVDSLI